MPKRRPANAPADTRTGTDLQTAIDRLARAGGGRLKIPRGIHRLHNALRLRSGVHLVGEPGALLIQEPGFVTPILDYLGYGHYEVTVRDADRFRPGMGIHIADDQAHGFYTTQATVTAVDGQRVLIDRPLHHDYNPDAGGRAAHVFSLIEGAGVRDVSVRGLTLRGHPANDYPALNGCRGGGIFLIGCRDVTLSDVTVERYRGDALSFQQCTDITITGCILRHNRGGGLHPGSGSVRYRLLKNRIHDNDGCGIFYCLRTTHSACQGNRVERNGQHGISIGERDTHHQLRDNHIRGNGLSGLVFREPRRRSGDACLVEDNIFEGNGGVSCPAIEIAAGLRNVALIGNHFAADRRPLIRIGAGDRIVAVGNRAGRRLLTAADWVCEGAAPLTSLPADFPATGPDAARPDDARHLAIARMD